MNKSREFKRDEIVKLLKTKTSLLLSPSHNQVEPAISCFSICRYYYDQSNDEIYHVTWKGSKVILSKDMPAYHIRSGLI